ncbi:MAG: hypothetical protein WD397_08150 [Wenzhouxiangellaceae bacterium]
MRKVLGIAAIVFLAGCASTNYSDINNSEAVISNLTVSELGRAGTGKHQLDVKFDYSIKDYKELAGLYICNVMFSISEDEMITTTKGIAPCKIDSKRGSVSIKWETPLSTSAGYSKENLRKLELPLEYHVTIHQKKARNTSVIIGMSEPLYLTLEK